MFVREAEIRNFRNLDAVRLEFSPSVNLLLGANGQGKTNLLECLHFIALGRSHRGARGDDLIRIGSDHLHVSLVVEEEGAGQVLYEYGLERGGRRRLKIDGQAVARRSELVGRFAAVFFSPESIALVRGAPELRRRFVDQGLATLDAAHLENLQAYLRALRQKARLLRDARLGIVRGGEVAGQLRAWNGVLARHAVDICRGRAAYIESLQPLVEDGYRWLAGDGEKVQLRYRPRLEAVREGVSAADLEQEILAEYDYIGRDEMRRGRPLSGPHMDDLEVRLRGLDLRSFGSQGETRTAAISLILAQSEIVYVKKRVRPVLFFDDIFSELDRQRALQLQERAVRDHQVFVATARPGDVDGWRPEHLRTWRVEGGALEGVS
jgi:DNA replication and repair protein RecF